MPDWELADYGLDAVAISVMRGRFAAWPET
jgi:hypothetical protein